MLHHGIIFATDGTAKALTN